jgi:acetylornithine deacetylase/succinyl-diaminopimelate desuccinylase-like protein
MATTAKRKPSPNMETVKIPVTSASKKNKAGKKRAQPHSVRVRKVVNGKGGGGNIRVGKKTMDVLLGKEDLSEWTLDELVKGYKAKTGRAPNVIPREVYQELARRMVADAQHKYVAELGYAVEMQMAIIRGIETEERKVNGKKVMVAVDVTPVQAKALETVIERVLGAPQQNLDVNVTVEKPYEKLIAAAIVPNEADTEVIVDAEIVEEGS